MLKTDLSFCEKDLQELLVMFEGGENLDVRHLFSEKDNKVVNTIVVGGKAYAYGNLVHGYKDNIDEIRVKKRFAKLALYKALSAYLGKCLPWGALTGIRPTKLAYRELEEGGDFIELFTDVYKVSKEKTELTKKVIEGQRGIYKKDPDNTDFFAFIPFCPSRCKYCSFITADVKSAGNLMGDYVSALENEIQASAKYIKKLRSIYVGGGTPVALDNESLTRVLSALGKINTGVEFTVEAGRPDRITEENLKIMKDFGVTRICVNPQTFNQKTLDLIGRNHTVEDVIKKYELAKKDFSVNMDLIAGLDGESVDDFISSLEKAISHAPDGITVHTLAIKHGSYLAEETKRLPEDEIGKMVSFSHDRLPKNGYAPYYLYRQKYMAGCLENVGYYKTGERDTRCIYNVDTMEEISRIVAVGANAISKTVDFEKEKIARYGTPKDVKSYLNKLPEILKEKEEFFAEDKIQRC